MERVIQTTRMHRLNPFSRMNSLPQKTATASQLHASGCQAVCIYKIYCRFPADRGQARTPPRSLQRLRQNQKRSSELLPLLLLLSLLIFIPRKSRHHKTRLGCRLNAGGVEWVERHGCRESRPRPWMADGGGPTERRRSEGTSTKSGPNQKPDTWLLGVLSSNPPKAERFCR